MTVQQAGLVMFTVVVGLNAAGLMLDAVLNSMNLRNVTHFVQHNPWAAVLILGINLFGTVGLALHFTDLNGSN